MTEIITFSVTKGLREEIDKLRGDIARSKFISRIIEDAVQPQTKRNLVPATGQFLEKPGQPVGKVYPGRSRRCLANLT